MPKTVQINQACLITWLVITSCCSVIFASPAFSNPLQEKQISISVKNQSLSQIIRQISKKSGLTIYFVDADVVAHQHIDYEAKEKETTDILKTLLENRGLFYEIISPKIISIHKKTNSPEAKRPVADTTINVFGKIINEQGDPIVGASVRIKGTQLGTTTASDGSFNIAGSKSIASIIITNVAYLTKEISLRGKGNIGITKLEAYIGILDEAQIVAYGKTSRRLNTGDVTTIKAEDISKQPVNNPLLALAGRVPGLQITQVNGIAGGGVKVLIQGQNSLTYGNDPFYVIDGVPFTSQLLPNLGGILGSSLSAGQLAEGNTGNPLSFINPQDIESIEVLKDADATAIYGSRAANGAILISTKKGKSGETKVDFNLQKGFGKVTRQLSLLNTQQYIEMRREAKINDNASTFSTDYDINGTWDTIKNTDWQKELIGKTAQYNDGQISVSGGSGMTNYLIGGNYHRETTAFIGDLSDQKGSLHFNVNSTSQNSKLKISLSGTYLADNNHLIAVDFTDMAMIMPPNSPAGYNADGTLNWGQNIEGISTVGDYQPFARLKKKYQNKTTNLISNINLSYEIVKGLEISASIGYTNMQSNELLYIDLPSAYQPELSQYYTRKVQFGDNNIKSWIIEPQIRYSRRISVGELSVFVGSTLQQRNSNRQLLEASGFNSDLVMDNINAATSVTVPENSSIASVYKYNAVFGRINYNIQNRYIINLTARRDGSSRFGSENHFHNFGAIGVAWIFSNENWIKNNSRILSFGKLRGSYGTTGNDQIGDYAYMSLYDNVNPEIPYRGVAGLTPRNIANPYLQWEETRKLQVGVELGFIQDKVILNTAYFRNRSSNQLLFYPLPIATGVASILSNFPAIIQNNGWEFALTSANVKRKNFSWNTNINLTIPSNKLVKYDNLENSSYANNYIVGQPFTSIRIYKYNGVNPTTGIYEFTDIDGKTVQDPTRNTLNKIVFFNTAQRFYGGISNTLNYKRFQLDFLFQFIKQYGKNNFFGLTPAGAAFVNQPTTVLNRWQKDGDITKIQKYNSNRSISRPGSAARDSNEAWKDASYIRLKNVSFSWSIPESVQEKLRMKNFRVFIQCQNLLTFTKYEGLDPETLSSISLPPLRVMTFGINAAL